jgi:hypothetical protein
VHYWGRVNWGRGLSVIHLGINGNRGVPMIVVVAYGTIVALCLVLVAIGVAATGVKAATCENKKLVHRTVLL